MAKVLINENVCKGCSMCVNACPLKIIELAGDTLNAKGYHPARLTSEEKCVGCAACATMCPDTAITVEK